MNNDFKIKIITKLLVINNDKDIIYINKFKTRNKNK